MRFASLYDEACFRAGPAALFTPDPRGNLRVDPERTREVWLLQPHPEGREDAVYLLTDRATGVKMLLATNCPILAELQPRGTVERLPDYATARAAVAAQWAARTPPGPENHG